MTELEITAMQEENAKLKSQNLELKQDLSIAIEIIKKIMATLGLLPMPAEPLKAIIKAISKLSFGLISNSNQVAKQFDFIKDIVPLAKKYIKEYGI